MTRNGHAAEGDLFVHSVSLMGTVVTIQVMRGGDPETRAAVMRAAEWFRQVEANCSRFDPDSEVTRLARSVGTAVHVSATLFHAAEVALAIAAESDGAFDPAIGQQMAQRGFTENYRTGAAIEVPPANAEAVSFRDVRLDARRRTITVTKPLMLDLGAVAKGLAVDLAARELEPFGNYAIDAGGDLFLAGHNPGGEPWRVGIRHPRDPQQLIGTVRVSNRAVCSSGDYERKAPAPDTGHHIIDPRTGMSVTSVASVTVIAPAAVLADAIGTAVFVLGVRDGIDFLERHGVDGLIVTPSLEQHATRGMHREYQLRPGSGSAAPGDTAILRHT
jgi:FAD:protein FMN transferase